MNLEVDAYIALGSNLDGPEAQLRRAVEALGCLPESRLVAVSSFYRSAPMGPRDQPDYLNAVACLRTRLAPEALLDALQAIEAEQGRVREGSRRWGPRPLDLDILLYGDLRLESEHLDIPHPGVFQRNFVLYPLHELRPDLVFPDGESLAELIKTCPRDGLERMESE
jgi:2-amino-4-hydroxy-6-hydroxymethyldihydropteridine diphosphokinase